MKLNFKYGGVLQSAEIILEFTKAEQNGFWSEPFFHFYPDVDKEHYNSLSNEERLEFLKSYFTAFEEKNKALLDEKIERYNAYWQEYEPQIVDALSEAFATDLSGLFNDLVCNMGFSPICPRFLDKNSFNNFYLESEKGALGTSMHEIIHFVWFYVWQKHFGDDPEEYETPHLKWILSEMVVEPIMRDPRLCSINPYFADNAAVYPYFYTFKIDGKPVLDLLYEMLGSMPIEEFMEQSYRLCLEHEDEIRKHIEENENA